MTADTPAEEINPRFEPALEIYKMAAVDATTKEMEALYVGQNDETKENLINEDKAANNNHSVLPTQSSPLEDDGAEAQSHGPSQKDGAPDAIKKKRKENKSKRKKAPLQQQRPTIGSPGGGDRHEDIMASNHPRRMKIDRRLASLPWGRRIANVPELGADGRLDTAGADQLPPRINSFFQLPILGRIAKSSPAVRRHLQNLQAVANNRFLIRKQMLEVLAHENYNICSRECVSVSLALDVCVPKDLKQIGFLRWRKSC